MFTFRSGTPAASAGSSFEVSARTSRGRRVSRRHRRGRPRRAGAAPEPHAVAARPTRPKDARERAREDLRDGRRDARRRAGWRVAARGGRLHVALRDAVRARPVHDPGHATSDRGLSEVLRRAVREPRHLGGRCADASGARRDAASLHHVRNHLDARRGAADRWTRDRRPAPRARWFDPPVDLGRAGLRGVGGGLRVARARGRSPAARRGVAARAPDQPVAGAEDGVARAARRRDRPRPQQPAHTDARDERAVEPGAHPRRSPRDHRDHPGLRARRARPRRPAPRVLAQASARAARCQPGRRAHAIRAAVATHAAGDHHARDRCRRHAARARRSRAAPAGAAEPRDQRARCDAGGWHARGSRPATRATRW